MSDYREDAEWQAAQRTLVAPAGSNSAERLVNSIRAAHHMYEVECDYERPQADHADLGLVDVDHDAIGGDVE
ncbi:hypothetical protein [Gordonia otitidis]|uniref:Uncharacterized protein n=1 Tax=Gordonia otitidis (strain DSM 44809 / CCUG 52243 / JCM 12355 / NBRC 100426 / IFM 10032) TaxID=1108044 RepID=H5TIX3_GORO1|nr:hypothetical protein [Gordonia otitidis]GAB33431.1 hypothetical protein GOOTI_065_00360 [Gordonia otitidis NBRC 100426]